VGAVGATGSRGYMGAIGATGADAVQVKVYISKRRVARQAAGCPGHVLSLIFCDPRADRTVVSVIVISNLHLIIILS